jgi:hypothetical protein
MAALSDYLENELLDHILRNSAWTPPTSVWIALFTADNGLESGVITGEVATGSYARIEVGGSSGRNFNVAASGATDNDADITFPTATADWGTVSYVAIMDASTAGNVLIHGSLAVGKVVNNGDTFKFSTGDFDVTMD